MRRCRPVEQSSRLRPEASRATRPATNRKGNTPCTDPPHAPLGARRWALAFASALAAAEPDPAPEPARAAARAALQVDGNRIVDADGQDVALRGVSVLAPEQNDLCEYCNARPTSELIDVVVDWNSRVVRLPVTEIGATTDLAAYDAQYIAPYVAQAVERGIYIIDPLGSDDVLDAAELEQVAEFRRVDDDRRPELPVRAVCSADRDGADAIARRVDGDRPMLAHHPQPAGGEPGRDHLLDHRRRDARLVAEAG